jgi:hypothetical protein
MPFYTFETKDKNIDEDKRIFIARLSFSEYDAATTATKNKEGWYRGKDGPTHPITEKSVKSWRRRLDMDNVNCNFAQPWESSKWDNFEYRAGYNMVKAQKERRNAEDKSHMGANPMRDQEGFDLGRYDIENHEGRID